MPILTGVIASSISGHLWAPSGAYDAIASTTVGSGGVASVTFSGIPSTYTHLQLRCFAQTNRGTYAIDQINLVINSDTGANYSWHNVYGDGSNARAEGYANQNYIQTSDGTIGTGVSGNFGAVVYDLLDYANTNKYKTIRNLAGSDCNGLVSGYGGRVGLNSGSWRNTSAITTLTITPFVGSLLNQYSSFALYGIR
jgi:hypothetical protein